MQPTRLRFGHLVNLPHRQADRGSLIQYSRKAAYVETQRGIAYRAALLQGPFFTSYNMRMPLIKKS